MPSSFFSLINSSLELIELAINSLKEVIITKATSISSSAFEGCSSLETLQISEGLPKIDKFAFAGMSGLKEINIPSTVTEIAEGAFMNCTTLETIDLAKKHNYKYKTDNK